MSPSAEGKAGHIVPPSAVLGVAAEGKASTLALDTSQDVVSPQSVGSLAARSIAVASGRAEADLAGGSAVDPIRWAEWVKTYEERANDVGSPSAPAEGLQARLARWFRHVDGLPEATSLAKELEGLVDWDHWMSEASPNGLDSSQGDTPLFLGKMLAVCRRLAEGDVYVQQFAETYWNIGGRLSRTDAVRVLVLNVFEPMQRSFLSRLIAQQRQVAARVAHSEERPSAPAADRIVQFDHNSEPDRQALVARLGELRAAIATTNQLDEEQKDRSTAEVEAGLRLFAARSVRVAATAGLAGLLGFLMALSPGFGVSLLANIAYDTLKAVLRWARDVAG